MKSEERVGGVEEDKELGVGKTKEGGGERSFKLQRKLWEGENALISIAIKNGARSKKGIHIKKV